MHLLRLSIKSIRRRWKEIIRACIATFAVAFFVTGILLFQENMYQWQIMTNKERFGDWFMMQTNTSSVNKNILDHPYIAGYSKADAAVKLYDSEWKFTKLYIGHMNSEFMEQGHIELDKGRMPQADNEIVMDWNTLHKLGYSSELGSTLVVNYYGDDNESDVRCQRQEEFELVGVLSSYTDVWKTGKRVPGALVSKERYEAFDNNAHSTYVYKLNDSIKTDDYSLIYEAIKKQSGTNPLYNDYLYGYKPWGAESVYNHIYLVVMIVGIAALTYQLVSYRTTRTKSYIFLRNSGATKSQINIIKLLESFIILVPASLLGIVAVILVGLLICRHIEFQTGIVFYDVDTDVIVKGLITIVVAMLTEWLVGRLLWLKVKLNNSKRTASGDVNIVAYNGANSIRKRTYGKKSRLKARNLTNQISLRLIRSNGLVQNLGVRLFSLAVSVIIIICVIKTSEAYEQYVRNKELPDFVGYQDVDKGKFGYNSVFFCTYKRLPGMSATQSYGKLSSEEVNALEAIEPTDEMMENYINGKFETGDRMILDDKTCVMVEEVSINNSKYVKNGNTNLFDGFSEEFINTVANMEGVSNITYSAYESMRPWAWTGMSAQYMAKDKLDVRRYEENGMIGPGLEPYCNKYLYATQYLNPTEELYSRLSKYIDEKYIDYKAFCDGEQIIVFVDKNADDEYDTSIKVGTDIRYGYYDVNGSLNVNRLLSGETEYSFDYSLKSQKSEFPYAQLVFKKGVGTMYEEIVYDDYGQPRACGDLWWWSKNYFRERVEACVSPKVAGVVYLTDEIKEEFKDIVVDYGYYTAIASVNMGELACERQNDFLEDCLNVKLSDDEQYDMKYNQLTVTYDLAASFSATHNILSRYCEENDVTYNSLTEEKEVLRTRLINSFIQNGVTIVAVIIMNIFIGVIIAKNRVAVRKSRFKMLRNMGARKGQLVCICMHEAVRESLWCICTMPLVLLFQYVVYLKNVKKI